MEKKTAKKKLSPILLIVLAVVVLAGTAVGLWLGGVFGPKQAAAPDTDGALYWNLERDEYVAAGIDYGSGRLPRPDGFYYITFGSNGEKLELKTDNKSLVDKIDMMEVMCLDFDQAGNIVGVSTIEDYGYEMYARSLFVSAVEGNTVYANNAASYVGMDFELTLEEDTQIYNVNGGALMGYQPCQPQVNDELVVVKNPEGKISHVYVKPYMEPGSVYLNTERLYSSTLKASTREPDALGYFTYTFAIEGEQVTLRCRDQKLANDIDKTNAPLMDLVFDEDGLIIGKLSVNTLTGGKSVSSWYDVTSIDGLKFTTKRTLSGSSKGTINEHVMTENCKIVNNTTIGNFKGEFTDLRVGDRVHCLTDSRGNVCYILVVARPFDGKIGLNVKRQWDSTNKISKRTPAEDGYYYVNMAIDGVQQMVKTKDKSVVDKLDSFFCYGVKLDEHNEVIKVSSASTVYNGSVVASYYDITAIDGNKITTKRVLSGTNQGKVTVVDAADDCQVYLAADAEGEFGEATELKVGDRIHCFTTPDGKARLIYVVNRLWDADIYWNVSRKYSSTTKETTRVPDADGWYWFDLAVNGKRVTLKTNEREIANKIDSAATKQVGLLHWNGIITKVVSCASINGYQGGPQGVSWVDIYKITGNHVYTRKFDTGKYYSFTMASNCKIYNVDPDTASIIEYVGEPTTLQVGDRIHAHHNADNLATLIFVVDNRVAPLDTKAGVCPCQQGVNWEPWDGTTALENGKSYYLTNDVIAPDEGYKLEGMSVNLRLDGHTISSSGRVFWAYSNSKLNICDHGTRGKLIGSGVKDEAGGVIRSASTAVVNLWNIDVLSDGDDTEMATEGGLISCAGRITGYNVNFVGGAVTGKGGNIFVSTYGTFRAFDSTITGGQSGGLGGNIYVMKRLYLENCQVADGNAATDGDNLVIDSAKECVVKNLTLEDSANGKNMYLKSGKLSVSGDLTVNGGSVYQLRLGTGKLENLGVNVVSAISVTADSMGVVMTNANESMVDCFTLNNPVNQQLAFVNGDVRIISTLPPKPHDNHCICVGGDLGLAEHTCKEITNWQELTIDSLTTSTTSAERYMFKQSGNYYLAYDMKLGGQIDILPGQEITVCLNGCTLEIANRAFMAVGTLNITDCDGSGTVKTSYTSNGGVVKLSNSGTFNLYGGTLTNTSEVATGGACVVVSTDSYSTLTPSEKKQTTFNMYGGKLSGGKTSGSGGNVTLFHDLCTFNMYGGVIENGKATNYGGNIKCYSQVNLLGGTITGGSASKGNDVYFNNGSLTLGGKLSVPQITITSGLQLTIHDQGLTVTQPIKLVAAEGVFATNVQTDLSGCFKVDGYDVVYDAENKTLSLVAPTHPAHCVCNGADLGLADHTCTDIGDWKPLTESCLTDAKNSAGTVSGYKFNASGNYFLTGDLELSKPIFTQYNQEITICLNGHKLYSAGNLFTISGVLNLCDCVGTGEGVANSTAYGGVLKLSRGGTVNVYGGTYSNLKSVATGGGVLTVSRDNWSATGSNSSNTENSSVANIYGGKFTGGTTSGNGGNITVFHTECQLNIYGGIIENGVAAGNGGNLKSGGPITILGGTITGGTAAKGDDIYFNSSSLTLGGHVNIGQITISGKQLEIADEGLTVTQPIQVIASAGVFATNVQTDLSSCFKADGFEVVYNAAEKTLSLEAPTHAKHCACVGGDLGLASHSCTQLTDWKPLSDACFTDAKNSSGTVVGVKLLEGGNYYLAGDYHVSKAIYIQVGQNVNICLNGYTLSSDERVIQTSGTLTVTDCTGSGNVIGNSTNNGGCIKVTKGGTLNIYAGTFSNTKEVANGGGIIVVSRDGASAAGSGSSTPNVGNFNFYGGKLTGGKTSGGGGVVIVFHEECTFTMYGGIIENGVATGNGGNVRTHGTTKLLGGTIRGGSAAKGDDVYIQGGTLTLGGNLSIGTLHVNSKSVAIHSAGLKVTQPIVIEGTSGAFATNVCSDLSGCFTATGKSVVYNETEQTLTLA